MRAVVDTNVLVSAIILPEGSLGPVILRLRRGDYMVPMIWAEHSRVGNGLTGRNPHARFGLCNLGLDDSWLLPEYKRYVSKLLGSDYKLIALAGVAALIRTANPKVIFDFRCQTGQDYRVFLHIH